jgi:hypothetical protein
MIFIDGLHTYCHLTFELERFGHLARKYLTLHDSSPPWEAVDDSQYAGGYSEYRFLDALPHYDRNKRGVWNAIVDFLQRHHEWRLKQDTHTRNHQRQQSVRLCR